MQYIPFLLCLFACPVGMGLMLWMAMRPDKKQSSYGRSLEARSSRPSSPSRAFSPVKMMVDCGKMCLNWRVVGVLVLIALVTAVVAPQWLWGALPLLLVAACPLSMLVMLFSMRSSHTRQRLETGTPGCPSCETQPSSSRERGQSVIHAQGSDMSSSSGEQKRENQARSLTSY